VVSAVEVKGLTTLGILKAPLLLGVLLNSLELLGLEPLGPLGPLEPLPEGVLALPVLGLFFGG